MANAHHFSGYAGTIALSLIAVPVVVRTTDNMLRLVPNSLLEAAFALGAPRWLGAVTPVGGALLIGGWLWLAWVARAG